MENYWEMKIKRQMVPKSGKSFVFFFPKLGNFLESHREKNVTEIGKFWEIKMEHIFFPVLEIKCIFSQNMGNYMKTIVKDPLPSPKPQNQLFPFRSHLHWNYFQENLLRYPSQLTGVHFPRDRFPGQQLQAEFHDQLKRSFDSSVTVLYFDQLLVPYNLYMDNERGGRVFLNSCKLKFHFYSNIELLLPPSWNDY